MTQFALLDLCAALRFALSLLTKLGKIEYRADFKAFKNPIVILISLSDIKQKTKQKKGGFKQQT